MARTPNENQDAVLSERVVARVTKGEKEGLKWLVGLLAAEVEPALARSVNEGVILRKLLNRELATMGWPGAARGGDAAQAPPRPSPASREPLALRVAAVPVRTPPLAVTVETPARYDRLAGPDDPETAQEAPAGKPRRPRR